MAPLPKLPGARVRERGSRVVRLETVPEHWPSGVPELEGDYLPATLKWWDAIWSGPVAKHWLVADVASLELLAWMRDQVARGDSRAMLFREIRALEDRFGLSPVSRRRLGWDVTREAWASDPVVPGGDDRWLRVVSDDPEPAGRRARLVADVNRGTTRDRADS